MELDHKLVESTQDGHLVFALNADSGLRKDTSGTNIIHGSMFVSLVRGQIWDQ